MSTIKAINVQHPSSATINIVNDSSGNVTVGNNLTVAGTGSITGTLGVTGTVAMGSSFKRNRIINGNMVIDQRNAGASGTTVNAFTVDRWTYQASQASKGTWGQNLNSVSPVSATAQSSYLGFQSSSAYSVLSSDAFSFYQPIEGFNCYDLQWGTVNAKTVTLSFWVYSSLTGTFGGSLKYYGLNISYPFSYTVSSANTWTFVTITIPGYVTTALPSSTSGGALVVNIGLGVGTTQSGTAGSWATSAYISATGAVSVVGTNGATFYITGVQLEVGTKATPYEMQIYSDQLAQCQRYFTKSYNIDVAPGTVTYAGSLAAFSPTSSASRPVIPIFFPVSMRTAPTLTAYSPNNGATGNFYNNDATANFAVQTTINTGSSGASWLPSGTMTANAFFTGHWTASAEL